MPIAWPCSGSPTKSTGLNYDRTAKRTSTSSGRTSAELCAAILQPNERAAAILRQYLARIDDDRLRRVLATAVDIGQSKVSPAGSPVGQRNDLWKGLSTRGNV
jgi:hypothetical protein